MDLYKIKSSEIFAVKSVRLHDGRDVKKLVDKSLLKNMKEHNFSSDIRNYVQLGFFFITLWIGADFYFFVNGLENGTLQSRPPGVEGFLPISSLVSFRYFILTGIVNHIHPSGFFIFIAALIVSTFIKKGFCSWICPIGYVSESLYHFGSRMFGRNFTLAKWIDISLRSLKYFLLAFFVITISAMSAVELDSFIHSDYNKLADIKMYMFFAHISMFSLAVIGILILLSLIYKDFWCRYACPYGALLGITSLLSPFKVRRVERTCIDCGKCATVCPSHIPVDRLDVVNSTECTACYSCVEICPIKNTLKFSLTSDSKGLTQTQYAIALLGIYFGIVGVAMLFGMWQNNITIVEYAHLFKNIDMVSHGF